MINILEIEIFSPGQNDQKTMVKNVYLFSIYNPNP